MIVKKHKLFIIAFICLLAGFFSYRYFTSSAKPFQDIKIVEVEKLEFKSISQSTNLVGIIKAKHATVLSAQYDGILSIIAVAGTNVIKGDLIANISNLEIEKHYNLTASAEMIAKDQHNRTQKLFRSDAYSQKEFETQQNTWISAQKDLVNAKIAFDKLKFYAPFDGIVGSYKVQEGTEVKIGDPIVVLYDPSKVVVEFDIPSSVMSYIDDGQKLFVSGKEYKLAHVQRMLDEETHMSPASVEILCNDCLIGSNVEVELVLKQKERIIVIPFEAVFLDAEKYYVYVIKDNKTELREVKLGMREKDKIEIVSGVEEKEEIVIQNTGRLYPGVMVKIHKP
jgi:membrane fusion protein, multidrug efflux system